VIGTELSLSPNTGLAERIYIHLFGIPINGLRIRLRRILPFLTGNPSRILDAGCGRGVFTYELAKRFPEAKVVGIDLDQDQLRTNKDIAQRANISNIEFQHGDVAKISIKSEFDLVLSVDNLEHVEDDQGALRALASALQPGGRLILHVPGYERRWFLFSFRENFSVPGHRRPGYTLEAIIEMISATNLLIVEQASYTFGWLETFSNNISYLITKAEAKNRIIYALFFPLLNLLSWLGRNSHPPKGAGILVIATRK